jgi:hypothetical protein
LQPYDPEDIELNDDRNSKKISQTETQAKIQGKLMFDAVNEILVNKLPPENSSKQWLW